MYEAFRRGDVQAVIAALDPQVEWWEVEHFFTFRGQKIVKFQQYTDTAQFLPAVNQ